MRSVNPSEHQIQSAIVEFLRLSIIPLSNSGEYWNFDLYHRSNNNDFRGLKSKVGNSICLGDFLLAIPNGHKRSISEGKKIKKEGGRKGVSDLFFAFPIVRQGTYIYHGLWIEVKTIKGKLSKEQKEWINLMRWMGYGAVVVHSLEEAIFYIKKYMKADYFWQTQKEEN